MMKKTVNIWEYKCYYYCLQLKLRQGNIFTGVWQSFCSRGGGVYPSMHWAGGCIPACTGGVYLSMHWAGRGVSVCPSMHWAGGCIPACTGADTPPEQTHTPWVDTPSPWPWQTPPPPPTMATATNGTHPTGIHSCCHCL